MSKERNIKELLEIVKEEFISRSIKNLNYDGFCQVTRYLAVREIISYKEEVIIDRYILAKRPKRKYFYNEKGRKIFTSCRFGGFYFYKPYDRKNRLRFINKLIKELN